MRKEDDNRTIYINRNSTIEDITLAIQKKCEEAFFATMYIAIDGNIEFTLLEMKERNVFDLWRYGIVYENLNVEQVVDIVMKFTTSGLVFQKAHISEIALAIKYNLEMLTPQEFAKKYLKIIEEDALSTLQAVYHLFEDGRVHEHVMKDIDSLIAKYGVENLCLVYDDWNAFLIEKIC